MNQISSLLDKDISFLVKEKYNEKHRRYHNYNHINYCLDIFDSYFSNSKINKEDQQVIKLALIFHDIVYDPTASNNEEKSCQLFQELFCNKIDNFLIDKVSSYILATKSHISFDYGSAVVIDCDLAILGATQEEFINYEKLIREEYSFVPEESFNVARKVAMNKFAAKNFVFITNELSNSKFESQAKINLNKYL